ncbi:MAG: hypothetical protein SGPRY_000396 [Prymnesium sp.]
MSSDLPLGRLEALTDDLLDLLLDQLAPASTPLAWPSSLPLRQLNKFHYAQNSLGAAHCVQLCKLLAGRRHGWASQLAVQRRAHWETLACFRVLEAFHDEHEDWPLQVSRYKPHLQPALSPASSSIDLNGCSPVWPASQVLRLRGGDVGEDRAELSHITPIARHVLRMAYCAVARDVHPDRHSVPQATLAMSVLNEVKRPSHTLL